MTDRIALLTYCRQYAGPAALAGLGQAGWTVACHDLSFTDPAVRAEFEAMHPGARAGAETDPEAFVRATLAEHDRVDCLISNDFPQASPPILSFTDTLDHFEAMVDELLLAPVRLLRLVLPAMKAAGRGSVILVTSGAPLVIPSGGGSHGYTAARAGANRMVRSLGTELAPHGIRVNAIAPYFLHSQTFFPTEIGPEDPAYAGMLAKMIPMKRFGRADELSGLFALYADPDTPFLTAQVTAFSGGGC